MDQNHWKYKKQLVENHFQQKYDLLGLTGSNNPGVGGKYSNNPESDGKNSELVPNNPGVDSKYSNNPESDDKNSELYGKNLELDYKNCYPHLQLNHRNAKIQMQLYKYLMDQIQTSDVKCVLVRQFIPIMQDDAIDIWR